jgi:hypothetical protein
MRTAPQSGEPLSGRDFTVVLNLVPDVVHGLLAESRFVQRSFLPGGEHNMYELAFAAAQDGFDVELRGLIDEVAFERLREGTGAAPKVDLPARRPATTDLVIVPEGWQDPAMYARLALSGARLALFVLAAPGLFGWPFGDPDWRRPDPVTVDLSAVARPEHFRAIHEAGFELLTHSPGLADAAHEAGVPCAFVGTGRPTVVPAPAPHVPRQADVAALLANRWEPLVREVLPGLDGLRLDLIDEVPNAEVLERLSQARVLLWPSRIEGHATIPWEARSVGCVPVALSSNRFAVGLTEAAGSVVVDEIDELAPAIRELLADSDRWSEMSARAIATSRDEVSWAPYRQRVSEFLGARRTSDLGDRARASMGQALLEFERDRAEQAQTRLEEIMAELERVRADRLEIYYEREQLRQDRNKRVRLKRRLVKTALAVSAGRSRQHGRDERPGRADDLVTSDPERVPPEPPDGTREEPATAHSDRPATAADDTPLGDD